MSEQRSHELVQVPFYEDSITAIVTPEGRLAVAVRPICDAMGLNVAGQMQKLRGATAA